MPAQASSFTRAGVNTTLFNFNTAALNTNTFAKTDAFSQAGDAGAVFNVNDAAALFTQDPAYLENFTLGQSNGSGTSYLGLTEGSTEALGQFFVEDLFSFHFDALLDLAYAVDEPGRESAEAAAGVRFSLFASSDLNDIGTLADEFSFSGNVSTGNEDFLSLFNSPHLFFEIEDCSPSSTGSCSFQAADDVSGVVFTSIQGNYNRNFQGPTYLTLFETKFSGTRVKVPEPGVTVALLFVGVIMVRRRYSVAISSNQ